MKSKKNHIVLFTIGDSVAKRSGKPFKSGKKIATIAGFAKNPQCPDNEIAASFHEDDSLVNLKQLKMA